MTQRAARLQQFLAESRWSQWDRRALAGDASNRRYERLVGPNGDTVVLMDAPPERGENTEPFVRIATHLRTLGLSAPEILAQDTDHGILVLQDLGDGLFARLLDAAPDQERHFYTLATDTLIALHRHPPLPELPKYAPPFGDDFIALAYGWYRPGATGLITGTDRFCDAMNAALIRHGDDQSVMILRDFHAENLVLLPDQTGIAQVGLLDFQDAMAGHPAYDLVSLLTDCRRDVSPKTRSAMVDHYVAKTGCDKYAFESACAVLSVQRNLRILGVFARLSLAMGKAHYVDLIPRVWGHLMRDLGHPELNHLRDIVLADLPEPTPEHLQEMRARCATVPLP